MKKIKLNKKMLSELKLFHKGQHADLYNSKEGKIIKIFDNERFYNSIPEENKEYYEAMLKFREYIVDEASTRKTENIVVANKLIYNSKNEFCGFTMNRVNGLSLSAYFKNNPLDLHEITKKYYELERIIEEGNDNGIVFPDLISKGNIMVENETNKIKLIDSDGFQVDNIFSNSISSELNYNNLSVLRTPKYMQVERNGRLYFTNELDRFSLLVSFIWQITGVNLPLTAGNDFEALREIADYLGLTQNDFLRDEIFNCFTPFEENNYFDDEFLSIGKNYKLEVIKEKPEFRRLVKKR